MTKRAAERNQHVSHRELEGHDSEREMSKQGEGSRFITKRIIDDLVNDRETNSAIGKYNNAWLADPCAEQTTAAGDAHEEEQLWRRILWKGNR